MQAKRIQGSYPENSTVTLSVENGLVWIEFEYHIEAHSQWEIFGLSPKEAHKIAEALTHYAKQADPHESEDD